MGIMICFEVGAVAAPPPARRVSSAAPFNFLRFRSDFINLTIEQIPVEDHGDYPLINNHGSYHVSNTLLNTYLQSLFIILNL